MIGDQLRSNKESIRKGAIRSNKVAIMEQYGKKQCGSNKERRNKGSIKKK